MKFLIKSALVFFIFTFHFSLFTSYGQPAVKPYNENQDARAELKKAIVQAQQENKHILVQFGGNWCPWCMRFHALVNGIPQVDSLMKANYIYFLLNVSQNKEKRDYTLFQEFEYPNRFGYPVFVVLDKNGKRLNTQDSDAFEYPNPKIKGYDTTKVIRFLTMWSPKALDPVTYTRKP
ncbi:MAG: thioredoxin family protein [Bacteroidales bacterium]|nr:thioredoxin family protein [Bacteroidales bacterium]